MNSCIPDWNFEADHPLTNQKKPTGPDHELVELLWRNGQVVLHSQTNRKQGSHNPNESRQVHQKHDQLGGFYGNSGHLIHGEEAVSMIQYPLEDSFEKEFGSHFFSELASCDPLEMERPIKQFGGEEKFVKFDACNGNHNLVSPSLHTNVKSSNGVAYHENPMPPPRFQISNPAEKSQNLGGLGKVVNFSQFSALGKGDTGSVRKQMRGAEPGKLNQVEVKEGSMMTVGSSYSGSNQVIPGDFDVSRASSNGDGTTLFSTGTLYDNVQKMMPLSEGGLTETLDPTLTTSSGGSGSSFGRGKQSNVVNSNKRKGRDAEDSECQSEAAETESAAGNKRAPQSGSSRRTRAAEVHNLSERRRRDRINEKMKALQELIPHSNKTDKASMLDEAIEYLKSLQLQLQVMWMGGGMTPMMFPGVQHYMSRMGMGMGMGPAAMPSMHNPMQLPRVPIVDQCMPVAPPTNQAVMCQTPVLNPVDYHNQMQNPAFQEQYARLMGFHHMQTMSQPMNMFRFNSQSLPQSQMMASTGMNTGTLSNGAATNEGVSGKMSKSFQPLLG